MWIYGHYQRDPCVKNNCASSCRTAAEPQQKGCCEYKHVATMEQFSKAPVTCDTPLVNLAL